MHWHPIEVYALSLALAKTVTRPISYTVNSILSYSYCYCSSNGLKVLIIIILLLLLLSEVCDS